jgi:hypothetical protein
MLIDKAEWLEAEAALLEHGANKPGVDQIIGPPKPPAKL